MLTLSEIETVELLYHLATVPGSWTESQETPGLWIRSEGESALCAIQISENALTGMFQVSGTPLSWSQEETETFLDGLVRTWTSFPRREALEKVLQEHGSEPTDVLARRVMAVPFLPPACRVDLPEIEIRASSTPGEALFQVVGGGFLLLQKAPYGLWCTVSLPSSRAHQSFGPPLHGFLAGTLLSHDVHTEHQADAIFSVVKD